MAVKFTRLSDWDPHNPDHQDIIMPILRLLVMDPQFMIMRMMPKSCPHCNEVHEHFVFGIEGKELPLLITFNEFDQIYAQAETDGYVTRH